MQRVFRWVDVEGASGRRADERFPSASLRPTGLVVFAILDRPRVESVRRPAQRARFDPAWDRSSHSERDTAPQRLRQAAGRSVDWLLGR